LLLSTIGAGVLQPCRTFDVDRLPLSASVRRRDFGRTACASQETTI